MNHQPDNVRVRRHFEDTALEFDAIYSGRKSAASRFLDRVFRRDMYERYQLAIEECAGSAIDSVLDVGSGSGQFCLPLAKTKQVVLGVDFSLQMVELARRRAQELSLDDRCQFVHGDFLELEFGRRFDSVLAIGLFDYISNSEVFLQRMRGLATVKLVATFPCRWTWRAPIRWLRLRMRGCPVYFFTAPQVRRMMAESGFDIVKLDRVGHIFFVVATPKEGSDA